MTVSDAGSAIGSATVRFDGMTKTTSGIGKVTFRVPHGTAAGRRSLTVSKPGYASKSLTIRVT